MEETESIIVIKPNARMEDIVYTVVIEAQSKHKFKIHLIPSLLRVGMTISDMFSNLGFRYSKPKFGVMTVNKKTGVAVEVVEIELEKIPAARR